MVAPIFILFLLPLFATLAAGPVILERHVIEYIKTVAGSIRHEMIDSGGGRLADKAISLARTAARQQGRDDGLTVFILFISFVVSFSCLSLLNVSLIHIASGSRGLYGLHRTGMEP